MHKTFDGSNLASVSWENEEMTVIFSNGNHATYLDVPKALAVALYESPGPGAYLNRYIKGRYRYHTNPLELESDAEKIKRLEHYEATTLGLWATDRPDLIPETSRHLLFEIQR